MSTIDIRRFPSATEVYLCRDFGYFPVLVNVHGEEILAVVRAGAGHVGVTGRLEAVRSPDGGRTWEPPVIIVDTHADDRNPAVGVAPDGTVVLAYHAQASYGEDGSWMPQLRRVQMRVTRSRDGGRSWEDNRPLGFTEMEIALRVRPDCHPSRRDDAAAALRSQYPFRGRDGRLCVCSAF